MKIDYHNHFEYGDYDETWVEGFFNAAAARGIDEIGITEHSHTFPEFYDLYVADVLADDSPIGKFQSEWLKQNKFKHGLDDYFRFMDKLRQKHKVKIGIEVCNFRNQDAVYRILRSYDFDYIIGSVHFLRGWGFDSSKLAWHWDEVNLREYYDEYAREAEKLCLTGFYDVLGHPFNLRLFGHKPTEDVTEYLTRVATAMGRGKMAVDVNTGSLYRYPAAEITPYGDFMRVAFEQGLPIITSSDAHQPEDCGRHIDRAIVYAKSFGFDKVVIFDQRQKSFAPLG